MFELSVAKKYLLPRRDQLSVSCIAIMSVFVISVVVWLMLVFLSVTDGIETRWVSKLTTLHGPIRITPRAAYFSSYYHEIDRFATASNYSPKSIREKAQASCSDPYCASIDMELPRFFPKPDKDINGTLIDPVRGLFAILNRLGVVYQDFEVGGAMLRIEMLRPLRVDDRPVDLQPLEQHFITQVTYVASLSDKSPTLHDLFMPLTREDVENKNLAQKRETSIETTENGIFLPKSFQESGVLAGDKGYLSFSAQGASSIQEQQIPIIVKGFYDPGIMAVGSKCILAPFELVHSLNLANSSFHMDPQETTGIQVWSHDLKHVRELKRSIEQILEDNHLSRYWKVNSYHDYDFAKDLLEQFQSDKTLFTLVGFIILVVACSNIISLLALLVNDKKKEIGILQAMGASKKSIAFIFAFSGGIIGALSGLLGTIAALFTLKYIDTICHFLSRLQGHDMFNAAFYGATLPNALSHDAALFICIVTPVLSLIAGLIPAVRACRLHPSLALKE